GGVRTMRKVAGYIAVAVVSIGLTWWYATATLGGVLPAAPAVPAGTPIELTKEEEAAVGVYESVNKSVVHITSRSVASDDFGYFSEARAGTGSGSILTKTVTS